MKENSHESIEKSIVFTPIYRDANGYEQVLTPEQFEEETQKILGGAEDTLGITLAEFDSKDYKDAAKQADKFAKRLHKASDYYDLLEEDAGRVKDFIKEQNINTLDELSLLNRCVQETESWAEAMRKFSLENVDIGANNEIIENLDANLSVVDTTIEKIDEAAKASMESTGLTKEQIENINSAFSDLEEFDYDKLFESSAEGVRFLISS